MSGFAPSCCTAPCRTALRAAPALLLAIASGHALAQAPLAAFPDAFGHSRAYTPAERISANLLAGGMSRLAAVRAQQVGAASPAPWAPSPPVTGATISDDVRDGKGLFTRCCILC